MISIETIKTIGVNVIITPMYVSAVFMIYICLAAIKGAITIPAKIAADKAIWAAFCRKSGIKSPFKRGFGSTIGLREPLVSTHESMTSSCSW